MAGRIMLLAAAALALAGLYLVAWPVPIEPLAWTPPPNPGYAGPFAVNQRLKGVEALAIAGASGPEDVAIDAQGRVYAATHDGQIVRLEADGSGARPWADTGGRPLGIEFDRDGNLIVADALLGLLSVAPDGAITVLATEADGVAIGFADDLDVAADGRIYFSDASTRFAPKDWGGTYPASLLDLMEHGGNGRLLVYDPEAGRATTLADGLSFANGVAVSPDQSYVLVNETGAYRVLRYWLAGAAKGRLEPLIEALPAFPDNISAGLEGRFWVALVSPRNALVDALAEWPFLRKMVQRLPAFVRPKAVAYGHVIAIDGTGKVVQDLQDPEGGYPIITSVTETADHLYLGSLVAPALGRLDKAKAGL